MCLNYLKYKIILKYIYCIRRSANNTDLMNHETRKCCNVQYTGCSEDLSQDSAEVSDSLPRDNCELPDNARASHILEIPKTRVEMLRYFK